MLWRYCVAVIILLLCQLRTIQGNIWEARADVVFVLDSSDTVGPTEWEALRSMLLSLVQQWTIGPSNMQVGVVTYGGGAYNEFFLNNATDATQLQDLINAITFRGGTADAAEAISLATVTSFSSENGMRDGVPHIIVHVTDGPSSDPAQLLTEAQHAHAHGDIIFNIGVGAGVQLDQLAKVASDPSSRYVLQADTFTSLSNLVPLLSSRILNEIPVSAQALPQPSGCLSQVDLVLLIDSSSSVGQEDFGHLEDFVKDLTVQLPIGPNQVQLGVVQFSGHPSLEFPLNMYTDRMSVLRALENLQFLGGGTNTGDAIQYVTSNVFAEDGGARTGVPRVVVVITDGLSISPNKTAAAADYARQNNIGLIAVGVGSNINTDELNSIANEPGSDYVFNVTSYKNLQTVTSNILDSACTLDSMITPPPTLPPGFTTPDPCSDKIDDCENYDESACTDYEPWAREYCPRRCGFCQTAEEISCMDRSPDCASYGADFCTSDQYQQFARANCTRFCGYCGSGALSLGFYGRCMYNGYSYSQSERWQDGCNYDCVCENAQIGQYRCYNRCPVYHDLPPECTLVGAANECCLRPVCNFNQVISTNEVSAGAILNAQNIAVCEYQGKQYYQGQTWEVGCQLKCVCTNASMGSYQCQDYCPTYPNLPSTCRLVQKAGQCCREPVCEFNTQTGSFSGFGTLSGIGVGMTMQGGAVCEDVVVDCQNYGRSVCTEFADWSRDNCAKYCNLCTVEAVTAGPNGGCYYQGIRYSQAETWQVDCSTACICEDAARGYSRCYNSCPTYLNLPGECTEVKNDGDCCSTVQCTQGTFYPSATNVLSIGNGGGLAVVQANGQVMGVVPTLPSGSTVPPGTYGGSVGLANIRLDGCLFNGRMYVQNQQWHDGCSLTCTCQDASVGQISCRERCPKYENVPSACGTQPDPSDPCCTVPACPVDLGYIAVPVYGRGVQSIGAVMTPSLPDLLTGLFTARYTFVYSGFTVAPPTAPVDTLSPGGLDYCEYKGQRYSHGESWEDGCQYNCMCEDAYTGSWRCVEKCERYVDIPKPYCYLEQDPLNPCCMRPRCNFLVVHGQIEGNNTIPTTTLEPTTPGYFEPMCVYKGAQYAVGQTWFDGCDLRCKCDNADTNIVTCLTRCPSYPPEYDSCQQLPDPDDPSCCMVPVCPPTPTPSPGVTEAPYRVTPQVPVIPPGIVAGGNITGFCVYSGMRYAQGERWEDGCDFNCVCEDAVTGRVSCTERCERFGPMPSSCRMVTDYTNPCCQVPSCTGFVTPISGSALPTVTPPTPTPVCVYNNAQYLQGQVWQEGCDKVCRCEDAQVGLYVCTDRCPRYPDLPPECTLVVNSDDECCLKPRCVPSLQPNITVVPIPELIPTLAPGRINATAAYPTPTPGPAGETPSINFCIFNGVPYARGATWQDGCKYNCECLDPASGGYQCTERCPIYTVIPQGCILIKDASDPCCDRPVCSPDLPTPGTVNPPTPSTGVTGSTATPAPGSTVSPTRTPTTATLAPLTRNVCVYKSSYYTQGQTWFDDCDYRCTCEDSEYGVYRCTSRCPRYEQLPPECVLGPDPADPLCCQRPSCQFVPQPSVATDYLIPPIKPGVVVGGSVTPTPLPLYTPTPGPDGSTMAPPVPRSVCIYNGQEYTQGQKWADACDYDCECVDALAGRYQCTEKCFKWSSIPAECTMVKDPNNPCCEVPFCDTEKPTPVPQTTVTFTPGEPFIGPDGSTLAPPTAQTVAPPSNRCIYNGVPYMTGDSWEDGCDLRCVCENGVSGTYRCDQRCAIYDVPQGCDLVTDPEDACCRVPYCAPVTATTLGPNTINTEQPSPGTTQAPVTGPDGSTLSPPLSPTQAPTQAPGTPALVPITGVVIGVNYPTPQEPNTGSNKTVTMGCTYNGVVYRQGEQWEDGCRQNCVCLNDTAGVYQCTERCTRFVNLPANCRLVVDPADSCCKVPLCQTLTTQSPEVITTRVPEVTTPVSLGPGETTPEPPTGQTFSPTPSPSGLTRAPIKMCEFRGQYYLEGQQWYDGCEKVCVCYSGDNNAYVCSDRCPVFENIPPECQLVASPSDPDCCMVPQCVPTPGPSGYPTAPTGVTIYTNPTGVIVGSVPTVTAGTGVTNPPIFGTRRGCFYKGREYEEGQRWEDACDYNCVCEDGVTGLYRCMDKCPTYPFVPSQCDLVPDPMDFCCRQMKCDFTRSTPNPFSPTPAPTREPNPNLRTTVTPSPGPEVSTASPTPGIGVPTPTYQAPTIGQPFTFCVYNGVPYRQGETWSVGCSQTCTCDDSTNNYYSCGDRCPTYQNLPDGCSLSVDPNDACCLVPECYQVPTARPNTFVTPRPGQGTVAPVPISTGVPGKIVAIPNTDHTFVEPGCVRLGVRYNVGDTWQDGCQYNCECLDTSGTVQCVERCTPYLNIPNYCAMVPDPEDPCCMKPSCLVTNQPNPTPGSTVSPGPSVSGPTETPQPGVTSTPVPSVFVTPQPQEVCVYKGVAYTEGQQWYDDCDLNCVCEDGRTGFYRCSQRCPTFTETNSNCRLVPDTRDPTCCVVPECATPDPLNVTGLVGFITGSGAPTTPTTTQLPQTPVPGSTLEPPTTGPPEFPTPAIPVDVCVYLGRVYTQGQQWQDGCTFNCECFNASTGQYRCTDRCPRYSQSILSFCTMVRDPEDACCQKPDCSATPTPQTEVSTGSSIEGVPPNTPESLTEATPFPTLHPTQGPGLEFCVYKGIPYRHGQTWNDGCDKTCRCEDVVTGQVNCDDRCPVYTAVPADCQLVTDPQDSCCRVPDCPVPTANITIIPGPYGTITGMSLPPGIRGPLIRSNVCIYHGRTYQQGDMWDDGCAYTCECIDSTQGKYQCQERCQRIVQMPPTCMMISDPDDQCCQKPYCLPWPPRSPTPEPGATPTGSTLVPVSTPIAVPGTTSFYGACFDNGVTYFQDQLWYVGCNLQCVCEDAQAGFYRCQERCVRYEPSPGCVMVPDPQDPNCCEIPRCTAQTPSPLPSVSPTPGFVDFVTPTPGELTGIGQVPNPTPTAAPTPGPGGSTALPGTSAPTTGCYYKGVIYPQSEKWQDGCEFICECVNGTTGRYTCVEKCPVLPQVPDDRCVMVQDPNEPCCMAPFCDFVNSTPFPSGTPTVTPTGPSGQPSVTPTPEPSGTPAASGFCVDNGAYYKQGEEWFYGCEQECVCINATTGFFSCRDRCKSWGELSDNCVLRVDPSDSCCLVPDCPQPPVVLTPEPVGVTGAGTTPAPSYLLTGFHQGFFTGTSGVGRPVGSYGSNTGFANGCVYDSTLYLQGQVWEDACNYICVCLDALRGKYQCTDRCITYYFLPPVCRMEPDPNDACCERARCYPEGLPTQTTTSASTLIVTGGGGTGPTGTGPTVNPQSTMGGFSGSGTPGVVTPIHGSGPTGTGPTVNPQSTVGGFSGTGTPGVVTPVQGSGPTGTGPTVNPQSTMGGFSGSGTPVVVTPNQGTGPSGTGPTFNPQSTLSGFTGVGQACVYKGVMYRTGDSWEDGCSLRCECNDEVQGLYTCTYRCPAYSGLPQYCHLQPDPNDACCKVPVCTVGGNQLVVEIGGTPTVSPTLDPSVNNVVPLGTHTILTGSTHLPGVGVQTMFGGRSSCFYKGTEYIPGETWDDGCDYTCNCIGDDVGLYRCVSKCPSYPALPYYCFLSTIPGRCCPSLTCDVPSVGTYNPIPQLEPSAKPTAGPDGVYPTPEPTVDPQLILGVGVGFTGTGLPGGGAVVPTGYINNLGGITDKCIYEMKMYNQGETWQLGCNYTCSCLDSITGFYRCQERCMNFDSLPLPPTCVMVQDPNDSCCMTPSCPDPNNTGLQITNITVIQQLYPIVGTYIGGTSGFRPGYIPTGSYGTIGGTRNGCVYKGTLHGSGTSWEDGCDFDCSCIDGTTGLYQCTSKCVTYSLLPPACSLVDVEGECCPAVQCNTVTTSSPCRDKIDNCYQFRQQACSGAYEAWAHEHCPLFCGFCTPDYTTTAAPCEDAVPNCENFGESVCTNVAYDDWVNSNCRKFCNRCLITTPTTTVWTTPESGCFDTISYCSTYGPGVCSDPMYKAWVLDNCQKYCGICGANETASTTEAPCEDALGTDTCALYGENSCGGQYFGWALSNCRKFCNLCGNVTIPTRGSTLSTAPPVCVDQISNCDAYGRQYCDGDYLAWAADNCANYCGLCQYEVTTFKMVTAPGWLVLLKGVAGVTGDLWQLWNSTSTINENVPQAMYLTNQFQGHYKPAIANQWDICNFETVKVAIYTNGEEQANIVFDVRNLGRNDWFQPENVISSTFNDLSTDPNQFNIARDPNTGHEFAVGSFGDCSGDGWILVSTSDDCTYQRTGVPPQFYFSTTQTVANTNPGELGEGDVFTILGQGGNCMGGLLTTQGVFTNMLDGCFYKTTMYNEGEDWLDGCDFNCTCQDATSGQYFCVDLCPTYNNLPAECSLDKVEGQCCPDLNCPYPTGDGCYYKNQTYPQGATWQDGCDYDCTCDDGTTGSYNCIGICQDWTNLPAACHMEQPDPGLCCPRPVCPPPLTVDFNPR